MNELHLKLNKLWYFILA